MFLISDFNIKTKLINKKFGVVIMFVVTSLLTALKIKTNSLSNTGYLYSVKEKKYLTSIGAANETKVKLSDKPLTSYLLHPGDVGGNVIVKDNFSGKYVWDRKSSDNTLILWEEHGGKNQQFKFIRNNYGNYKIEVEGYCLNARQDGFIGTVQCVADDISQEFAYKFFSHPRLKKSENGEGAEREKPIVELPLENPAPTPDEESECFVPTKLFHKKRNGKKPKWNIDCALILSQGGDDNGECENYKEGSPVNIDSLMSSDDLDNKKKLKKYVENEVRKGINMHDYIHHNKKRRQKKV